MKTKRKANAKSSQSKKKGTKKEPKIEGNSEVNGEIKIQSKKKRPKVQTEETSTAESKSSSRDIVNALEYLQAWRLRESSRWKFNKNLQNTLLDNIYNVEDVTEKIFDYLLGYLEGMKGARREKIKEQAQAVAETGRLEGQTNIDLQQNEEGQPSGEKIEDGKEDFLVESSSGCDSKKSSILKKRALGVLRVLSS
eukprot:CAMPEP_0194743052 /NCGR_PEP_ID=MMETSP0296-20130528/100102_1 /TAXON_ID=39354 /ORGANISM="Heterosigma akashiwo, Strain CCMP2393" /LENGTH=194 /DNA_ID=CAMNT_0039655047 /DNA_START=112 /DNA_END=696 /DNA_ORIENTATION=+